MAGARRLVSVAVAALVSLAACSGGDEPARRPARRVPRPSATAAPTTTAAVDPGTLQLHTDGLGVARFGDDEAPALAALGAALGPPDADTGYQATYAGYGSCPGDRVRGVRWKGLTVLFARGRTDLRPDGASHFVAFEYGPDSREPAVATAEGVGIGSTLQQLRDAYPGRLQVSAEDPFQKPEFRIGDHPRKLQGVLSGPAPGDRVELIDGGVPCGD